MATKYTEIDKKKEESKSKLQTKRESESEQHVNAFKYCVVLSLIILILVAYFFCHNNIYKGENDWVVQHDIIGTYGDFIGGVLGTLIALYSLYLLVKTLGNQLSVTKDAKNTNDNIITTNNTTIYQTNLQIFNNKFCAFFENYKLAKFNYSFDTSRIHKKKISLNDQFKRIIETEEIITLKGSEAIDYIAHKFSTSNYSDKRTYMSRVKSATNHFDELYASHRREMSVHFRNLYLLAKFIGETDNFDENGTWKIKESDRVEYAKSIRGQLSEGEIILLRYNCLTNRGAKMRPFVNQFNLIKHLPFLSLLEFRKHRSKLNSEKEANTLDSHFIELRKKIKEYINYTNNPENSNWTLSEKYSIEMNLSEDKRRFTLTIIRKKSRPATGNVGIPSIEKALNRFALMDEIKELYKDFMREALIVSNFYLFNGSNNTNVNANLRDDNTKEYAEVAYESQYPIVVVYEL